MVSRRSGVQRGQGESRRRRSQWAMYGRSAEVRRQQIVRGGRRRSAGRSRVGKSARGSRARTSAGSYLKEKPPLSRATPHGQSHKGEEFFARKTSNSSSVLHYAELLNSRPLGSPPPSPSGAAESCAPVRQHSSVSLLAHRASHGPVIIRLTN